jgi:hypothetical protein
MKVTHQPRGTETGGDAVVKTRAYSILATANMMKTLSSPYKDKIMAVVGEYLANAVDIHRMTGQTRQVEVYLPTMMKSEFVVKDFGSGLSDDDVLGSLSQYGYTTKDQLNTTVSGDVIIGGFGVGFKVWLAYNDTVIVQSRYEGQVTEFSGHLDNDGIPQVTLMSKQDTTEPNGLTIKVPVKRGDLDTFRVKLQQVLEFYTTQPKVEGGGTDFKPATTEYTMKEVTNSSGYAVKKVEKRYGNRGAPRVIIGERAFPLNTDLMNLGYSDQSLIEGLDLWLPMNSGVEVVVSREELSYTPDTIEALTEHFKVVKEDIIKGFTAQIKSIKNKYERSMAFTQACRSSQIVNNDRTKIAEDLNCFDGVDIRADIKVVDDGFSNHELRLTKPSYNRWNYSFGPNGIRIVILDEKKSCSIRTKKWAQEQIDLERDAGNSRPRIIQVQEDDFDSIYEQLGKPPMKYVTRVSETPYDKPLSSGKSAGQITTYSVTHRMGTVTKDYGSPDPLDPPKEYVVITHEKVTINGEEYDRKSVMKMLEGSTMNFVFKTATDTLEDIGWTEGSASLLTTLDINLTKEESIEYHNKMRGLIQNMYDTTSLDKMINQDNFKVTKKNKALTTKVKKCHAMYLKMEGKYTYHNHHKQGKILLAPPRSRYDEHGVSQWDIDIVNAILKANKVTKGKGSTIQDDYDKCVRLGIQEIHSEWESSYPMLNYVSCNQYSSNDVVEYVSTI